MSNRHSIFGGSTATRWLNCPGSVALIATVPPLPESPYAAEGTRAHQLAAHCLENGYHNVFAGGEDAPDDMAAAVQTYLDAVYAEMAKAPDAELYVETTFAFSQVGDGAEVYGSNDAIVYTPSTKRLAVFDYKHGVGVSVDAEDNPQLKFYAAGAYLSNPSWKVREVELVIVQPRARDADEAGAIKRWPLDTVELLGFTGEIDGGVKAAKDVIANYSVSSPLFSETLKTGSWCRWCDAAAICPLKASEALKAMTLHYADITDMSPERLPTTEQLAAAANPQRIADILKGIDILQAWANQVQEFAEAHLLAGTMEIPGWKVVEKIGRRKWIAADDQIAGYLGAVFGLAEDDIRPRKLVTLTEVEKQLKSLKEAKEDIDAFMLKFTIKESSGLTIAPATDRREAVNAAEKSFSGVNL